MEEKCKECKENCIGKTPCSSCRENSVVKEIFGIVLVVVGTIAAVWVLDFLQFVYYGR